MTLYCCCFWNILFFEIWRSEKRIALSEKKPPLVDAWHFQRTNFLSGRLVYNSTLMPKEEVFGFNVLNYLEVAEMLQLLLGL